jgi:hypothetical protein
MRGESKMQFNCPDYYDETGYNEGCCLKCDNAHPGCLCYDCKCKKCYWYQAIGDGKGICEKKYELILEKKRRRLFEQKKNNLLFEKKKEYYKNKSKSYSCQKCQFLFDGGDDNSGYKKIILGKTPVCNVCNGKINLTQEESQKLKEECKEEITIDDIEHY